MVALATEVVLSHVVHLPVPETVTQTTVAARCGIDYSNDGDTPTLRSLGMDSSSALRAPRNVAQDGRLCSS